MKVGVVATRPQRLTRWWIKACLIAVTLLFLVFYPGPGFDAAATSSEEATASEYGIDIGTYKVIKGTLKRKQNLSKILSAHDVPSSVIDDAAKKSKKVFDVRRMIAGNPYALFCQPDTDGSVRYFVYEQDPINYVIYDLGEPVQVYTGTKPVDVKIRQVSGKIRTTLYRAFFNQGIDQEVAERLADLYAWTIDFHHLTRGDFFKIVYEEKYASGNFVGVGRIIAANFYHRGQDYYGFYYEQGGRGAYYDENGESMEKAFLRAPLKYTRITSRPSRRRLHPILNVYKRHLGTDYAAPHGTPILSVGDGVVAKRGYNRKAGRHMTIQHNRSYRSQYLHLSRFAKGIRPGERVERGEVIGFVGRTGFATGPHLCFRFWKNRRVVNYLKEPLPAGKALVSAQLPGFKTYIQTLAARLDAIPVHDTVKLAQNR